MYLTCREKRSSSSFVLMCHSNTLGESPQHSQHPNKVSPWKLKHMVKHHSTDEHHFKELFWDLQESKLQHCCSRFFCYINMQYLSNYSILAYFSRNGWEDGHGENVFQSVGVFPLLLFFWFWFCLVPRDFMHFKVLQSPKPLWMQGRTQHLLPIS